LPSDLSIGCLSSSRENQRSSLKKAIKEKNRAIKGAERLGLAAEREAGKETGKKTKNLLSKTSVRMHEDLNIDADGWDNASLRWATTRAGSQDLTKKERRMKEMSVGEAVAKPGPRST